MTDNNKCQRGCEEVETLIHCWQDCNTVWPLWKIIWQFLKMLNVKLSYKPAIILPGTYTRQLKTMMHTKTMMYINV